MARAAARGERCVECRGPLAVVEQGEHALPVLLRDALNELRILAVRKHLREERGEFLGRRLGKHLGEEPVREFAQEAGLPRHARLDEQVERVLGVDRRAQGAGEGFLAVRMPLEQAQQVAKAHRLGLHGPFAVARTQPRLQPGRQIPEPSEAFGRRRLGSGARKQLVEADMGIGRFEPAGNPVQGGECHGRWAGRGTISPRIIVGFRPTARIP
jgi:hypothetical protein